MNKIQNLAISNPDWILEDDFGTRIAIKHKITPELKREGEYRELVRAIQDTRKKQGLTPSDVITLTLPENAKDTVAGFEGDLKKTVLAESVTFAGSEIVIEKV